MNIGRKIHNLLHPALGQVLMLHRVVERIGPQPEAPRLEVTLGFFEKTLDAFLQKGVVFIGIDQVAERIKTKNQKHFVCLTFDDGYLDTYTHAYPVLKERQIPFCVYMTRDFFQGTAKPHWNPGAEMMDRGQLVAMASDSLCTIGVHTCSHPHLSRLTVEEQRHEIADCKADIERLIGHPVRHLAYPYGDYNEETLTMVRAMGFETAVTVSGRPVRDDARLFELDRVSLIER